MDFDVTQLKTIRNTLITTLQHMTAKNANARIIRIISSFLNQYESIRQQQQEFMRGNVYDE